MEFSNLIVSSVDPYKKRLQFRNKLKESSLLQFPGAYNTLVARMIQKLGFQGVYVSGAVTANSIGLPDIGLTSLHEVITQASQISKNIDLPTIMDIDTGFGEALSVSRTVKELIYQGICGAHLEDQKNPKRCGHLDHKELVSTKEMCNKIKAGSDAKSDPNFLLIARTDARTQEGLETAIVRAKNYVDAGADAIFPEALTSEKEFELFRKAIDVPLIANMTEFGKSPLLNKSQLENLGYDIVIYPVTTQRLALKAIEFGLSVLQEKGSQVDLLDTMQSRKELYELLSYEDYNQYDQNIFNFDL